MKTHTFKIGDKVDGLLSDSTIHIGEIVSIDGHMVGIKDEKGGIKYTAAAVVRLLK